MSVNDATIRLITEFEGFVDRWYEDPAHGWKVPTAMYGHTNATGNEPFYKSESDRAVRFTKQQGIDTLKKDLLRYEAAVDKAVKVSLNPNQRGALVSFTYNLGEGNLNKSTLLKKVNAGDLLGASKEFAKWRKAGGKVLAGLTRRREAERQLFLAPSAISSGKPSEPIEKPVVIEPYEPKKGGAGVVYVGIFIAVVAAIVWFVTQVNIGA